MKTKTPILSKLFSKKKTILTLLYAIFFTFFSKTLAQEKNTEEIHFKRVDGGQRIINYYAETIFTIIDEKGKKIGEKKIDELSVDEIKRIPIIDSKEAPKQVEDNSKNTNTRQVPIAIEINMGKEKLNSNSKIIYRNDTLPTFPDGMKEFYKFVKDNFNIPSELKKEGKIYTLFTVETDGSLTDIKILRDLGFGTGKETIRVLNKSPKWIPDKNKTEPIRMQFTLPIPIHPQ
jgi:hypothetical protein